MHRSAAKPSGLLLVLAATIALFSTPTSRAGHIDLLAIEARVESDTFVSPLVGPSRRATKKDTSRVQDQQVSANVFIPVAEYAVEATVAAEPFVDDSSLEILGRAQVRLSHGLKNELHQQFAMNDVDYDFEFSVERRTPFMLSGFVNRDYLNSKVKTFATAAVLSVDGRTEFGMIDLMTRSMKSDEFELPPGRYVLDFHLDSRTEQAGGAESLNFQLQLATIPEPSCWALGLLALVPLAVRRARRSALVR